MPLSEYLTGWIWLALILGGAGYAAWRLARVRLAWMEVQWARSAGWRPVVTEPGYVVLQAPARA